MWPPCSATGHCWKRRELKRPLCSTGGLLRKAQDRGRGRGPGSLCGPEGVSLRVLVEAAEERFGRKITWLERV